jgi:molecular chaperone GrpE
MTTDPRATEAVETETPGASESPASDAAVPNSRPPAPGADVLEEQEPEASDGVTVDPELAALLERATKADEYLALAQRTQADFENYRKRAIREAGAAKDRGVATLAKALLPALDNLDRALMAAQAAAATAGEGDEVHAQLVNGVSLVQADVLSAFGRAGIEAFSPEGEPFDPQWHEAVAQAPVEGAVSGTVVEVYQRGYKLGDSVLRPARVLVAA